MLNTHRHGSTQPSVQTVITVGAGPSPGYYSNPQAVRPMFFANRPVHGHSTVREHSHYTTSGMRP